MKISKIVLTGGPCGGKSTALKRIENEFTQKGYKVIFIPETATELITSGISPATYDKIVDFERAVLEMQKRKEDTILTAVKKFPNEKILIVCDRGILDNKAFISDEEFKLILDEKNLNEISVRDSYDAVFHLVTAAKGAEEFYTTDNNEARSETAEAAAELDDKFITAWAGHPHLRVIDNSTDFENKIKRLITEISVFLGEPEPYEIERKFLIKKPNIEWLKNHPKCSKVEILQTYLISNNNIERRVRQRGINGNYTYYITTKETITGLQRIEEETRISQDKYTRFLMDIDTNIGSIRKTRYCLEYNCKYFEIDVYPNWEDTAILEIELSNADEKINIPDEIKVIKEVTDDPVFKNINIAKKQRQDN